MMTGCTGDAGTSVLLEVVVFFLGDCIFETAKVSHANFKIKIWMKAKAPWLYGGMLP